MAFSSEDFMENLDLSEILQRNDSLSPFLSVDSIKSASPLLLGFPGEDTISEHQHKRMKSIPYVSGALSSQEIEGEYMENQIDLVDTANLSETSCDPIGRNHVDRTDWDSLYYQELLCTTAEAASIKQEVAKNVEITCAHLGPHNDILCDEQKLEEQKNEGLLPQIYGRQEPEVKQYVEPTCFDVLLGRGGRSNHHFGNKIYREQVRFFKGLYKSSTKQEKTCLSQGLVDRVKSRNGSRFLCLDKTVAKWFVVSNQVARQKTSQALREIDTPGFRDEKRSRYQNIRTKRLQPI